MNDNNFSNIKLYFILKLKTYLYLLIIQYLSYLSQSQSLQIIQIHHYTFVLIYNWNNLIIDKQVINQYISFY